MCGILLECEGFSACSCFFPVSFVCCWLAGIVACWWCGLTFDGFRRRVCSFVHAPKTLQLSSQSAPFVLATARVLNLSICGQNIRVLVCITHWVNKQRRGSPLPYFFLLLLSLSSPSPPLRLLSRSFFL